MDPPGDAIPLDDTGNTVSSEPPIRRPKAAVNVWKKLQDFDNHVANSTVQPLMVSDICSFLKENGKLLDEGQQARQQLDAYFKEYRNLVRSSHIDMASKCQLLQLIELRAGKWCMKAEVEAFYDSRLKKLTSRRQRSESSDNHSSTEGKRQVEEIRESLRKGSTASAGDDAAADKVSVSEGKSSVPAKPVMKEDLLIRNSDSGKVMGIRGRRVRMIEQFSDTVISFQRVAPTQKERLLHITATRRESIERAKQLISETILRNTSPTEDPPATVVLMPPLTDGEGERRRCNRHSAAGTRLQRSSSLGHALLSPASSLLPPAALPPEPQEQQLVHASIYTGNSSHVLRVSANSDTLLAEAVQALRSHFDVKRSMRRFLPDFEFDESFSSDASPPDSDLESADSHGGGFSGGDADSRKASDDVLDCDSPDFSRIPAVHRTLDSIVATTDVSSPEDEDEMQEEEAAAAAGEETREEEEVVAGKEGEKASDGKEEGSNGQGKSGPNQRESDCFSYDKDFLIKCSGSQVSQAKPANFDSMKEKLSDILRE